MIISILVLLLYALIAVLVLELAFYIVGLFWTVPPRIRQIVYAIVGVVFLIWIVQAFIGSGASLPLPRFGKP